MAIYQYVCPNCDLRMESMSASMVAAETDVRSCPTCGTKMKRLIGENIAHIWKKDGSK